jgi:hypothetical protein
LEKEIEYLISLDYFPDEKDAEKLLFTYDRIEAESLKNSFGKWIFSMKNDLNIYNDENNDFFIL